MYWSTVSGVATLPRKICNAHIANMFRWAPNTILVSRGSLSDLLLPQYSTLVLQRFVDIPFPMTDFRVAACIAFSF